MGTKIEGAVFFLCSVRMKSKALKKLIELKLLLPLYIVLVFTNNSHESVRDKILIQFTGLSICEEINIMLRHLNTGKDFIYTTLFNLECFTTNKMNQKKLPKISLGTSKLGLIH